MKLKSRFQLKAQIYKNTVNNFPIIFNGSRFAVASPNVMGSIPPSTKNLKIWLRDTILLRYKSRTQKLQKNMKML
jgi:hypothetical protein